MPLHQDRVNSPESKSDLYRSITKYGQPNLQKAIVQLIVTFVPYFILWAIMIFAIQRQYSYWITLALAVFAGAFLIRIFIFFHDCTHGSFFTSRRANRIIGYITGIMTFTPFEQWRYSHTRHHATVGDLDRRGIGDVWTLTVEEYEALPRLKQLAYRIYRNPLIMFGLGPGIVFFIGHRFPHKNARRGERFSVTFTNLTILAIITIASATIGLRTYLLIQLPIMLIAGAVGVWLFYVQHQFEGVYWARKDSWDPLKAALEGSSYYKLPKVLQFFTGSIGLHHIHHVQPRIPNYNLQACYDETPALQVVEPLTLGKSLNSLRLNLWDEGQQKLVSFRSL